MLYAPKHAAPAAKPVARRAASVAVAAGATVAGGMLVAPSASASTVWDRVAACESGGNWSINTGNGFYGGLQFSSSTWRAFGGGTYASTANRATKAQQIEIGKKVLKAQGPGAWPVCSQRAGLTRSNGASVAVSRSATRQATAPTKAAGKASVKSKTSKASTGKLVVDGIRGPLTNRGIERWVGGSVNGNLTSSDLRKLEQKLHGSVNGRLSRDDVRKLQRVVRSAPDGLWGPNTTRALQRYLNSHVL